MRLLCLSNAFLNCNVSVKRKVYTFIIKLKEKCQSFGKTLPDKVILIFSKSCNFFIIQISQIYCKLIEYFFKFDDECLNLKFTRTTV